MRVRAVAVATERSNAVGTVELECTPQGLLIVYLGVGAFSDGYAPGALTSGTRVLVPWVNVLETRAEGDQIFLGLEPSITPHNRLTLTNFSTGEVIHERELGRRRWAVRIGAMGTAGVLAIVCAVAVSHMSAGVGAVIAIALGIGAAALVLAVGFMAEQRLGFLTLSSAAARQLFAATLTHYRPAVVVSQKAPPAFLRPFELPSFAGVLPRTTLAIVITLTAGMLGAVLTAKYIVSDDGDRFQDLEAQYREETRDSRAARALAEAEEPPRAVSATQPAAAPKPRVEVAPANRPAPADTAQLKDRCICHRAASVLWNKTIPRLSLVILSKKSVTKGQHQELALEIAAINNGDKELRELAMLVQFFERDPPPSSKRYSVANRPLYFEGPLQPGSAIKWSLQARGREFELENPILGDIGPGGENAAPQNMLAELVSANHRPVRLHGAMMLAYLGDTRAREAALKLKEALRDEESAYLERVLAALADVRACDLEVAGQGEKRTVSACVYNASNEPKSDVTLTLRVLDAEFDSSDPTGPPPNVLSEHSFKVSGKLESQAGIRASAVVELPESSRNAKVFEVFADR